MSSVSSGLRRTTLWPVGLLVCVAFVITGCGSLSTGSESRVNSQTIVAPTTPTATPTPNPLILAPATTPSAVGVCTQQMQFGADGNASPILCSDGAVNSLAWTYFDQQYPGIFAVGAYATLSQVQQAVMAMESDGTIPTEESAYCLAKAYFGWEFGVSLDPVNQTGLTSTCAQDIPYFP